MCTDLATSVTVQSNMDIAVQNTHKIFIQMSQ